MATKRNRLVFLKNAYERLIESTEGNSNILACIEEELDGILDIEEMYISAKIKSKIFVDEYNSMSKGDSCTMISNDDDMMCYIFFDNEFADNKRIKKELSLTYLQDVVSRIKLGYASMFDFY